MKLQLIKQNKYILVSDEKLKDGDWYFHKGKWIHKCKYILGTKEPDVMIYDENESSCFTFDCKKIIAGIPELPSIDLEIDSNEIIQSLQQTVWNVEVEMEIIRQNQCINKCAAYPSECLCEMTRQPKITDNSIKITKIL